MYMTTELWPSAQRSFADEIFAWQRGERVIVIAQLSTRPKSPYTDVLELGLMRVTSRLIPMDSEYEATVEEWLHSQGRRFEKPLRFDSKEEQVFPDSGYSM